MSNKINKLVNEYKLLESIHIPLNYKAPNRQYVEQAKAKIITGKRVYITVGIDDYLIKGYAAYIAYKELGYTSVYILRSQQHVTDLHCEICGRKCFNSYDISNMNKEEREMINNLGIQYVKTRINYDNPIGKIHTCKLCADLKGKLTYRKEVRDVIISELKLRGII